jgi:hypothetical protein
MSTETLEKFFIGRSFVIPAYQRDYAGTKSNIDDLCEDIVEALETNNTNDIGAFAVSQASNERRLKVVDGQAYMEFSISGGYSSTESEWPEIQKAVIYTLVPFENVLRGYMSIAQ